MSSLEYGLAAASLSALVMFGLSALFSALGLMP